MVDWAAARALLEEGVAEVFDVTALEMVPMANGLGVNHARSQDTSRPGFAFLGTIDLDPPSDRVARFPPGDPGSQKTVSYEAVLTAHSGSWPWFPVQRDRVRVIATGQVYQVEAVERDGSSRPALYLSKVAHARG